MTTLDHSSTPGPSMMTAAPVASTSTRMVDATSPSASPVPSSSSSEASSSTSSYVASSSCIDMDDDAFSFGTLPQMDAESTEQWDASVFEEAVDSFVKQMENQITPLELDTTWLSPLTPTSSSSALTSAASSSTNWSMWTAESTSGLASAIPGLSPTRSDSTLSEEDLDFDLDLDMDMDVPMDEESMKLLAQFVESCQSQTQNSSMNEGTTKFDFDLETLLASSTSSSTPLSWDTYGLGSPNTPAGKQDLAALTPTPTPSASTSS